MAEVVNQLSELLVNIVIFCLLCWMFGRLVVGSLVRAAWIRYSVIGFLALLVLGVIPIPVATDLFVHVMDVGFTFLTRVFEQVVLT